MKLYEKIYSQRKLKGMSQEELAEKLGVSRQAVSNGKQVKLCPKLQSSKVLQMFSGLRQITCSMITKITVKKAR